MKNREIGFCHTFVTYLAIYVTKHYKVRHILQKKEAVILKTTAPLTHTNDIKPIKG